MPKSAYLELRRSLFTGRGRWENYLVSERVKQNNLLKLKASNFFWRTTQQQEINYIEKTQEYLMAAEFKWNSNKKVRFSSTFTRAYPHA